MRLRSFAIPAVAAMLAAPAAVHAKAMTPCVIPGESEVGYFTKPRACEFHKMGSDPGVKANTVYVNKLRWRRWGARTATATGVQVGNGGYRSKLTVTLSGRERCEGDWLYRKVTMRAGGKVRFSFRMIGCPM